MTDDDRAGVELGDPTLEPVESVEVEIVGRLVEQVDVEPRQQQRGEADAAPPRRPTASPSAGRAARAPVRARPTPRRCGRRDRRRRATASAAARRRSGPSRADRLAGGGERVGGGVELVGGGGHARAPVEMVADRLARVARSELREVADRRRRRGAARPRPRSGCTCPASTRSSVDLPTPFGPTSPIVSALATVRSTRVEHHERAARDRDRAARSGAADCMSSSVAAERRSRATRCDRHQGRSGGHGYTPTMPQPGEHHPAFEEYCECIFELARGRRRRDPGPHRRSAAGQPPGGQRDDAPARARGAGLHDGGGIRLTDRGRALAESVVRRHRLAERFLTDMLAAVVGRGAPRGRQVGARDERVGRGGDGPAARQPHHLPARQPDPRVGLHRAARRHRSRRSTSVSEFTVSRIPEELEFTPGLLEFLEASSWCPARNGTVTAASPDGTVTVEIDGHHVGVGAFASARILVSA